MLFLLENLFDFIFLPIDIVFDAIEKNGQKIMERTTIVIECTKNRLNIPLNTSVTGRSVGQRRVVEV